MVKSHVWSVLCRRRFNDEAIVFVFHFLGLLFLLWNEIIDPAQLTLVEKLREVVKRLII
jgi:hypothetical protein